MNYHRRSDLLAQHLGATIHYVVYGKPGRILHAPLRYLAQSWQTWNILRRESPDIIFVQNPPIFCALITYIYSRCFGSVYVIDSHTGAFLTPVWRRFLGLHRWLSRRALATIVHNNSQECIVREWKCPYCVIGYTPGNYPKGSPFPVLGRFNVAVISTYGDDEPLAIIFAAAGRMPEVDFYVTGDDRQIAQHLLALKPENCHPTGYLPYDDYVDLLRTVDAVIDLTTRDGTLLMGGFEAVSVGTPLITSDWPILVDYFSLGTVHVPNTIEGLCDGVQFVMENHSSLEEEILRAEKMLQAKWEQGYMELQRLIQGYAVSRLATVSSQQDD